MHAMNIIRIAFLCVVLALTFANGPNLDQLRDSVTHEQQRSFIKISVLLDTATSIVFAQLQTALPQTHLARSQVYFWYGEFKQGRRTEVSDLPKPGRTPVVTSEENKELVRQLILESEGMRMDDLMYETQMSHSSLINVLKDIKAKKLRSRWIPHELTKRQQQLRKNIAGKLLARYQRERGFLDKIIVIDETWLKSYDPQDPRQTSEWLLPEQKP